MDIKIVKNQEEGAKVAFEVFKEAYEKGAKVFGLATGSSPLGLYEKIRQSTLDFSDRVSVNLDEYAGLSNEDEHSYHYFMNEQLFAAKPFANVPLFTLPTKKPSYCLADKLPASL